MPGLVIHTGNRLEVLVQQLASDIRTPLSSVFEPEIIITQSPGMARWIAMQLATYQRVSANLVFPFPNAFLNKLCEKLSLSTPLPDDPFDPTNMTFTIMKKLPACLSKPGYEGLRHYFHEDRRQLKLLQLSQRIAHLFDQYLVFRPDMIVAWDKRKTAHADHVWQADLWREIASGNAHPHRVNLHADLIAKLESDTVIADGLPERVSVFGISYLPAFHLKILSALSSRIPVNWYFLSPCREYWGEVLSDRDISRIREKYAHGPSEQKDLHLDRGNPLLASMGTLGRDFLGMIAESECDLQEHYVTPDRGTLLSCIQADILDMLDAADSLKGKTAGTSHQQTAFIPDTDHSIEIHACHSAMREIEVLHDNILDMLQRIPDLKPRDILVMTPDIDTYAPFIQAVFEPKSDGSEGVPFSLADRSALYQSRIMDAFFALIDLAGSRMEADKVTGLLEYPAVRQQFSLDEQDVAIIERWVKDLNIRWGIDDDDRRDTDLPFFTENTWKSGLDRLLLGYAMPGQDRNMFAGLLPCDDVEGDQGRVLGSFMHYFEGLLKSVRILETPRTLQDWSSGLRKIVESLFTDSSALEKELQLLKHLLGRLEKVQQVTGYDDKVELEAVTCQLKKDLTHASFGSGFLAGKVTFCAMLPMRSIPFRVICLLGMQGNAFPRDDSALGFDLMATQPRRGDRSRRNDDKYLFLEALMSARKKLYISYIGRDIQDNSPIAPSVLVSELIDYAHSGYGFPAERLVRQHPLQAFSADYFTETLDLFSYSRDNFTAAVAAQQAPARTGDTLELSTPPEAFKHMGAETLGLFYANPLKYFLQNRLGLYLEKEDSLPDASENFRLAGLEGYKAGQATFQSGLRGAQTQELMGLFKARGVLPPGQVGAHDFTAISLEAGDLASRMNIWTLGEDPRYKAVTLQIGDFSINGSLPDVYGGGMVYARFAKFNPRDLVSCWITHLLLCAENGSPECQKKSVYLSRDVSGVFAPLDNSPKILKHLLQLHWDGLSRPLPFYPKSSHVYARARLIQEKPRRASLRAAVVAMQGNQFSPGEIEEPYLNFFFDGVADLGETFERVALEIFEPLFEHFTSTTAPPPLQLKNIKEL